MTETELNELSAFVAECLGWKRMVEWEAESPTCDWPIWLTSDGERIDDVPEFATSEYCVGSMMRWLNERGYLVVIEQLPRGEGFLLDELTGARTPKDLPALVEIDHVHNYDLGGAAREFRTTPHVTAELRDYNAPFERFCFHTSFLGRTVPEAMCRVIKALVERFPDLRHEA